MRPALAIALPLLSCRSEIVVGVIEQDASSTSATSSTSTLDPTTMPSTSTSSSTAADDASSEASSSSSGTTGCAPAATDDGSATDESGGPVPTCEAPSGHSACDSGDDDPFHAIGLGCAGGPQETNPISAQTIDADATTFAVATRFGSDGNLHWTPREGSKLLVLSTGILDVVGDHVEIPFPRTDADDGDNPNPDGELPEPMSPVPGAGGDCPQPFVDCDRVGDCSQTLPDVWDASGGVAHDLAWLRFDVAVPGGTFGYRADLAWFTAEYPEAAEATASDLLVWWQSSEVFTGNVATIDGAPMIVAGIGETIASDGFVGNAPELQGTGFESTEVAECDTPWQSYGAGECPRGGSTPWLTLAAPAHPGETMTIAVAIFDAIDPHLDSVVLLDDWRWSCDGCTAGADCGLGPHQAE